ncbi:MAG: dihydrolipoyl dehydrogenase [Spirochaetales bacterium]
MYDIIIIGGGPGGYVAAERAGARGQKVLLIEKEYLGGTCLNWGCIPTKTLLNSAKTYAHALHGERFGVHAKEVTLNWTEAQAWKGEVIGKLRGGITFLMKKFGVEVVSGTAELVDKNTVKVADKSYQGKNLIIATGSSPAMPPIPGAKDNPKVVSSTGLLDLKEVPKSLVVIGGGVIGVEFASLFATLGSKVTVVEMMDEIIPFMDKEHAPQLRKALGNIEFQLGCKVEKLDGGTVHYTAKDGPKSVTGDVVLMAVGRSLNVKGLGLEALGVDFSPKGIVVNEYQQTNIPGVYAVGDVTGRSLLAHSASRMGEVAVSAITDAPEKRQRMRYSAIPWVLYSNPEAAGVGLTEDEAKKQGRNVVTATVPLRNVGRFLAENGPTAPGVTKVIVDKDTDRILGIQMYGAGVGEMIWGGAALIELELRVHEARELIFPHPTTGEAIRDALWELH